ncbi:MAG TPA: glycosyltransferase 87 family protein [Asanoa sp.]
MISRWKLDRLTADLLLYALSAVFAGITAAASTLLPHRAWGAIAVVGYAAAALAAGLQRATNLGRTGVRLVVLAAAWVATAWVPMLAQTVERADGRPDRAQEEVVVVEHGGARLVDTGTPYLSNHAIAGLPADDRLLGYHPYQPGMALFGVPRALAGDAWWTDARVWFALVTLAALAAAGWLLRGCGPALVRALQFATVFPICALTMATGGDDVPVLAFCLLALALCAGGRYGAAGVAVGAAAALKLFAWPIAAVLLFLAATRGRSTALRYTAGAVGLPVLALVPPALVDSRALVDNVVGFALGHGVVTTPAQSPLIGFLIAQHLPGGKIIALGLLAAAALSVAVWLVRRPPRTAGDASLVSGYGLLAMLLLLPSTRFGYLLYPIALFAWAPALHTPSPARAEPVAAA